jgi:hypothetical protein
MTLFKINPLVIWLGLCVCHAVLFAVAAQFPPGQFVNFWVVVYVISATPGLLFGWTGLALYTMKFIGFLPYIQLTALGWVLAAGLWAAFYAGVAMMLSSTCFANLTGSVKAANNS